LAQVFGLSFFGLGFFAQALAMPVSCMRCLGLFLLWGGSVKADQADQTAAGADYYIAAAFQQANIGDTCHGQKFDSNGVECYGNAIPRANLAKLDKAMEDAKQQGAQIIVSNEGGIDPRMWFPTLFNGIACEAIPEVSSTFIPCTAENWDSFPVTRNASCLARKHGMVTVINTCDQKPCKKGLLPCTNNSDVNCCPASGFERFNTQLALSETGQILGKYHKVHNYDTGVDYGETNSLCCWPPRLDYAYFDTSFGVRFGMHICFDIMSRTPGLSLAMNEKLGIRDFVYSTHWETPGPPMLLGTGIQQAWSRAVGVNLIAANAGLGYAHGGSGIYSKGRTLVSRYEPTKVRDEYLLVAKVPKLNKGLAINIVQPHARNMKATRPVPGPPVPYPGFQAFDVYAPYGGKQIVNAASGNFSCSFEFQLSDQVVTGSDRFMLMAVSGAWFGKDNLRSRSCVVLRCGTLSAAECEARSLCPNYKSPDCAAGRSLYNHASDLVATAVFESFSLRGDFKEGDVVMPLVGTSMGGLVDSDAISIDGGSMHVTLQKPLLNAMLYAIADSPLAATSTQARDAVVTI